MSIEAAAAPPPSPPPPSVGLALALAVGVGEGKTLPLPLADKVGVMVEEAVVVNDGDVVSDGVGVSVGVGVGEGEDEVVAVEEGVGVGETEMVDVRDTEGERSSHVGRPPTEKVLGAQGTHSLDPGDALYIFCGQGAHNAEPTPAKEPAAPGTQRLDAAAPEALSAVPLAQGVHEDAPGPRE